MALDQPKNPNHMLLTSFISPAGHSPGAWRMPDSQADKVGADFSLVQYLVDLAEDAKLDSVFFGDMNSGGESAMKGELGPSGPHEPVTTMAALAMTTKKIGLSGTISTTFSYPFQIARMLTGIEHLSGGRAGWNIVTSSFGMRNFGYTEESFPPNTIRYEMADEFVEICIKLWDSWADDAVIVDRENNNWVDGSKVTPINFAGKYHTVEGPLNMRRSPQGRPVLFQAGQSEYGMAFGAKYADGIYATQNNMQESLKYKIMYSDLVKAAGRDPSELKVLPGITPILGDNQKDAEEYAAYVSSMADLDVLRANLVRMTKVDIADIDLDDKIPTERWDAPDVPRYAHGGNVRLMALELDGTLRQLLEKLALTKPGHLTVIGTASKVADTMVEWFTNGACDGFNFNPPANTERGQLPIFNELVPELRNRGHFREEYEGTTLRDHFGLSYPPAWNKQ